MRLFHMSDTVQVGTELVPDYKQVFDLAEPFVRALRFDRNVFFAMILNASYVGEVLAKYHLSGMPTNETKWATEGLFEYIRQTEFPEKCSRLRCNYYFDTLDKCRKLYLEDWGEAPEEEREKIRLYEVDVDGDASRCDMLLFDRAFELMDDLESPAGLDEICDIARAYFRGDASPSPVFEILSGEKAVIGKDITEQLRQ